MSNVFAVILCGGSGTRLWPLSRHLYPKQFIPLHADKSLFQCTLQRALAVPQLKQLIVVCNEEHRFMAAEQIRQLNIQNAKILLEPEAKNTAPAVCVAALAAQEIDRNAILLALPADHLIENDRAFSAILPSALHAAERSSLVTFGVKPTRPETGYGYIKLGPTINNNVDSTQVFQVAQFVEKPNLQVAQEYLSSGKYLWNSGMFMFSAATYLQELEKNNSAIASICKQAFSKKKIDLDFMRIDGAVFKQCPSDSIDYAVMEKANNVVSIPINCGWNDIGSWRALWETGVKDSQQNTSKGDVVVEDCTGCYIHAGHRLVSAVGLQDHVIVETADAVLVAPLGRAQDVKAIVQRLSSQEREEAVTHRRVYRPWGAYEGIDRADRFQVKRITVNPGQALSLQMHHHRAEHWIVVKGTARVTRGDDVFMLSENESTFIPIGTKHRLENPGKIPLELIEVQSGTYLGEDDITRFDDKYGR